METEVNTPQVFSEENEFSIQIKSIVDEFQNSIDRCAESKGVKIKTTVHLEITDLGGIE